MKVHVKTKSLATVIRMAKLAAKRTIQHLTMTFKVANRTTSELVDGKALQAKAHSLLINE
jgi:Arc/MetJ family transcription regulator